MASQFLRLFLILLVSSALTGCFKSAQERADEHLENGLSLMEEGDFPRAIVEFRNTLKYDDDNVDAFRNMARANAALDRTEAAYGSFLNVVELRPNDLEARVALSEMAFVAQSWDEFDRHSGVVITLNPATPKDQAVALAAAYRAAVIEQDVPTQTSLLQDADGLAKSLPENRMLRRIRIDGHVGRGAYETALAVIDDGIAVDPNNMSLFATKLGVLGRLDDQRAVESTLLTMLDRFPDDTATKETYLRFLLSRDRMDEAEAFLEDLFAQATPEERNGAFVSLVNFLRQTKGVDAALARTQARVASQEQPDQTLEMLRASLIFDAGQPTEAIAVLEAAVAADPNTMTATELYGARTALAQMYLRQGDDARAREIVDGVLADDPYSASALKMRAAWQIEADNTSDAINDLRLALDQAPDDPDAMVLMANAYHRAGNKELMQSFLARAAESSNNAPRYAMMLARALMEDGKTLQAENALIASYRIAPGNAEVLQTLGQVYLTMDDLPRAEQVATELVALETDAALVAAQGLQAQLIERKLGIDQALEFLENQVTDGSDPVGATLALIRARLQIGQIDEALQAARDAVNDFPDDLRLRNLLALSYITARDLDAAEAEFEALLKQAPQATGTYLQLARLKSLQGDVAAGAAIIDQGLAVAPDSPDLLWGKASYLENNGDVDGAIAIYDAMYARDSSNVIVANNLASLLSSHRSDDASLSRAASIARRLNGTDVAAFQDTYGYIQLRQGNLDTALEYLTPAAATLTRDPTVQFHLGEVYAALARPEDALNQMRKALDLLGPLGDASLRQKITESMTQIEANQMQQ